MAIACACYAIGVFRDLAGIGEFGEDILF